MLSSPIASPILSFDLVRVIDGDTFVARIYLGFNVRIDVHVRMLGYFAPEHNVPGGPEATQYLKDLFANYKDLKLMDTGHKTFEREVCQVWFNGRTVQEIHDGR